MIRSIIGGRKSIDFPMGTTTYFPMIETASNPVYGNTGNTGQSINGQSYTFVPYDGLYFDVPPKNFYLLMGGEKSSTFNDRSIRFWDTSLITNMQAMFTGIDYFNQDIGNWNTSSVTNMQALFAFHATFNQDISRWDTSNVTNMQAMFLYAQKFNRNISNWKTKNVVDMTYMFNGATAFNQNLSTWCCVNIPAEPTGFSDNSALSMKPQWGVNVASCAL